MTSQRPSAIRARSCCIISGSNNSSTNPVDRGLRLREAELRVLVHDREHRAEGVERGRHCLLPGPHPVHVDVGVAGEDQAVRAGRRRDREQEALGLEDAALREDTFSVLTGQEELERLSQRSLAQGRLRLRQPKDELQLRKYPAMPAIGWRDVVGFFPGEAERLFVLPLLPFPPIPVLSLRKDSASVAMSRFLSRTIQARTIRERLRVSWVWRGL